MFCEKCGRELKGTEKFCPGCGEAVLKSVNDVKDEIIVKGKGNEVKKNNKKMLLWVIGALFLTAGIIIVLIFWKKGSLDFERNSSFTPREKENSQAGETSSDVESVFENEKETRYLCTETRVYDAEGHVEETNKYEYDEAGNKIKGTEYGSDGSIRFSWAYEYDEAGNMIKATEYDSDGSINGFWWAYEYDEAGNVIKDTRYDSNGSISSIYAYEYDEAGNMIKSTWYNSNGSIGDIWVIEYDEAGNRIKSTVYSSIGDINVYSEDECDEAGNVIKSTWYSSDGNFRGFTEYKYILYRNKRI